MNKSLFYQHLKPLLKKVFISKNKYRNTWHFEKIKKYAEKLN